MAALEGLGYIAEDTEATYDDRGRDTTEYAEYISP